MSKERLTTLRLVMATIKSNAQAARADEKTRTPHLRQILPYDKTELSGATHYFVVAGEPSAALVNHIVTAVKSQLKLEKK